MNFWDQRYSEQGYAYGTEPNGFLKARIPSLTGSKALCIAEGEGRNAVYLAEQGFDVTAVDTSLVGKRKAMDLASQRGVNIDYQIADLREFEPGVEEWDLIVSIFCPMPPLFRSQLHSKMSAALKHNGAILIEAYTPEQVKNDTGGGKNPEDLQTADTICSELPALYFEHLYEGQRNVVEGRYHTGLAHIVQAIARKTR